MAARGEYLAILDRLDAEGSASPVVILKELFIGPRRSLLRAEQRAEAGASVLSATPPPPGVEQLHTEFVSALRDAAAAARKVSNEAHWSTGSGMLKRLRQTGALERVALARRELRQALERPPGGESLTIHK